MHRTWAAAALAVALLLPGCLGANPQAGDGVLPAGGVVDTPVPSSTENGSRSLNDASVASSYAVTGCQAVAATVPAPGSAAKDVPPGFTLQTFDGEGHLALLLVLAWTCAGSTVAGAETGADVALLAGFFVDAPADLRGDVDAHLLLLDLTSANEALTDVLAAWNVSDPRSAEIRTLEMLETSAARRGVFAIDDHRVEVVSAGSVGGPGPGAYRAFRAAGGVLAGAVDLAWTEAVALHAGTARYDMPVNPAGLVLHGTGAHYWGSGYGFNLTRVV